MNDDTVLVTGGTGFLATQCIAHLLEAGYRVRTTVRRAAAEPGVRAAVAAAGTPATDRLGFVVADLSHDEHWAAAVAGCGYVLHVASPFPAGRPKRDDDLIIPAREGTVRVLRAARAAGVRRTVLTSSFGAIGYGHPPTSHAFTEADWTELDGPGVTPYIKSKTLAERAAWDLLDEPGGDGMQLTVVNPVGIFGPATGVRLSGSLQLIQGMLQGRPPGIPNLFTAVVDVRDVADLQLRAMTHPDAAGRRFIAAAGDAVPFARIAEILREHLGAAANRVARRRMPDVLVRLGALAVPALRDMTGNLGVVRHVDNSRARTVLGWRPQSTEAAIAASGHSLLDLGLAGSTPN